MEQLGSHSLISEEFITVSILTLTHFLMKEKVIHNFKISKCTDFYRRGGPKKLIIE